jgi:hypothetical protein
MSFECWGLRTITVGGRLESQMFRAHPECGECGEILHNSQQAAWHACPRKRAA